MVTRPHSWASGILASCCPGCAGKSRRLRSRGRPRRGTAATGCSGHAGDGRRKWHGGNGNRGTGAGAGAAGPGTFSPSPSRLRRLTSIENRNSVIDCSAGHDVTVELEKDIAQNNLTALAPPGSALSAPVTSNRDERAGSVRCTRKDTTRRQAVVGCTRRCDGRCVLDELRHEFWSPRIRRPLFRRRWSST